MELKGGESHALVEQHAREMEHQLAKRELQWKVQEEGARSEALAAQRDMEAQFRASVQRCGSRSITLCMWLLCEQVGRELESLGLIATRLRPIDVEGVTPDAIVVGGS